MRKAFVALTALVASLTMVAAAQSRRPADDQDEKGIYDESVDAAGDGSRLDFDYQFGVSGFSTRRHYVAEMPDMESGDRFTVRLRARQSVYAYVFVSNGDGSLSLLTPGSRDEDERAATRVTGREWVTLPDQQSVMRLDDQQGTEHVYLLVSRRPVADIERLDRDGDASHVTESWLRRLRSRNGSTRGDREYNDDFVRASYAGPASGVAFEEVSFEHR